MLATKSDRFAQTCNDTSTGSVAGVDRIRCGDRARIAASASTARIGQSSWKQSGSELRTLGCLEKFRQSNWTQALKP